MNANNYKYLIDNHGWIYIYDGDNEIAHVETYSGNHYLYTYEGEKFFEWKHKLCLNGSTFYMNPVEKTIVKITSDVNQGYAGHLYGLNGDTVMRYWDGDVRNSHDNEIIKKIKELLNY